MVFMGINRSETICVAPHRHPRRYRLRSYQLLNTGEGKRHTNHFDGHSNWYVSLAPSERSVLLKFQERKSDVLTFNGLRVLGTCCLHLSCAQGSCTDRDATEALAVLCPLSHCALLAHSYSSSSMKNCNRFFNVISLRGGNEEPALGIVDHYHSLSGTVQIWWLITVDRLLISKDDSCCNSFEFGFHRFIYGAYRPQVNDLGQKKLILHCLRHNHRPPVWRLFSSILPASIPPVLRSRNAR
ncbi:hypothetical protein T05_3687 [Trichinella murrelli]|uniref:Uncharacterized protein n=1 Tax=Trichinella murrelli TaxID=144512 RepID=A0A0V0TQ03_9BILA|nr:hypothetical protein T05_3687 [Trichinella murrelli]